MLSGAIFLRIRTSYVSRQKLGTLHGLQALRRHSRMAATNGAIGAVDSKTDKTLKLENVSGTYYLNARNC